MMIVAFIFLAVVILLYGILIFDTYSLIKLAKRSLEASKKLHDTMKEALNDLKEMTEENK